MKISKNVETDDGTIFIGETYDELVYKVIDINKHLQITSHQKLFKEMIKRYKSLQKKYSNIDFWIRKSVWKMYNIGAIFYSIRPYILGYGCDGTTEKNIHLLGIIWAERRGLDYYSMYKKAYPERDINKIKFLKDWYLKFKETVIPKEINTELLIKDLGSINNHSLERIIENIYCNEKGD